MSWSMKWLLTLWIRYSASLPPSMFFPRGSTVGLIIIKLDINIVCRSHIFPPEFYENKIVPLWVKIAFWVLTISNPYKRGSLFQFRRLTLNNLSNSVVRTICPLPAYRTECFYGYLICYFLNLNQWKSLRFSENSLNLSKCCKSHKTSKHHRICSLWKSVNFHWISHFHWFKFRVYVRLLVDWNVMNITKLSPLCCELESNLFVFTNLISFLGPVRSDLVPKL